MSKDVDALTSGRIDDLLLDDRITDEMASSLINDSSTAARIIKNLVDIAIILYTPRDRLIDAIDEQNAQQFPG